MIPDTGWAEFEKSDPEGYARFIDEELPLGRLGSPDEVASVITFLCSPRASMINGASVLVDGGETSVI